MSKQYHTPGPWRAIRPTRPSDGNHWQILAASPHVRGAAQTVCRVNGPWNAKNYAANARLIASAPDLLAMLQGGQRLVDMAVGGEDSAYASDELIEALATWAMNARAAIAEATGAA